MRVFSEEFELCPYCGYIVGTEASSKIHLAPGTILQGRYMLGKVLGQGGFGITYIAWDGKLDRAVAVKEYMPNDLASRIDGENEVACYNEKTEQQFQKGLEKAQKEMQMLVRFRALGSVVAVYDFIRENGTVYIIMELLRGRTVREILTECGRLPFVETMQIMSPILRALDAMHRGGMIHRDVAPDNIFVCEDGKTKLLDFGAVKAIGDPGEKTLPVMLKSGYAPIEQYSEKVQQGAYTDVYAACATMYKMLTGEKPPDSLDREKNGRDLALLSRTDAPQIAQKTILRGMAQNAADRIQSIDELLFSLNKAMTAGSKPFAQRARKERAIKKTYLSSRI